jgi:hypothetical protein
MVKCLERNAGGSWIPSLCKRGAVPACPSTNPVEQPIDLFFNRPAHTTLLRVGIKAWPIGLLVSSLFNRPQGENYACSVAK